MENQGRIMIELTKRENEVLDHISLGLKDQEIADHLYISLGTVKSHVKSIYRKLKVRNRIEATIKYNRNN